MVPLPPTTPRSPATPGGRSTTSSTRRSPGSSTRIWARSTELVATHTTQTNEVRRTAVTLPALGLVATHSGRPLALLEVGASAGLNLLVDRYGFRIGSVMAGIPGSPVQLRCAAEGELRPPVPDQRERCLAARH